MKRHAVLAALIALAAVLLLGSCDALFTNYFKAAGLGQANISGVKATLDKPSATDAEVIASISNKVENPYSDAFYTSLAADPAFMGRLVTRLEVIADAAATSSERMTELVQTALTTLVNIQIQTTRSMDIIKLLPQFVFNQMSSSKAVLSDSDIRNRISELIPPDISNPELADSMDGIINSWDYLEQMATIMRNVDPPAPYDMTKPELIEDAQIAVISALFRSFEVSSNYQDETVGAAFADWWFKAAGADKEASYYLNVPDTETEWTDLMETISNNATISTFLEACGVGSLEELFSQE